ncbi:phospholipase, patatin family protein [Pleomassaria siparia CBS 279.74]|uniref:Phospholipase, patatin family protein n=1 Tax=Pleomassaria siparia CBS 279.74 TaxID=1314801 RepID=A0A6G1K5I2_9PLEO|nr:phospholipase, patatin family protein [Pleomassaria siparia CBS 279.74]
MPGRGLNLLSLDGGGIRGLSSLQILKRILEGVARDRNLEEAPKPCEFFDMIGGTSTGGLIAIMLGRMEMTIDECIKAYVDISDKVFRKTHVLGLEIFSGNVRGKFDSKALEEAVKLYLSKKSLSTDCLLHNVGPGACKVFVCATSGSTRQTVALTSYPTRRTNSDRLKYTKVWQAARATSAASSFFDAITVQLGSYSEVYTDGGTGANNPINVLWHEAEEAFLESQEKLKDNVDCLISIGTGHPAIAPFGTTLKEVAKSVVVISTETENTAKDFRRNRTEDLVKSARYFRFNVEHGLEAIGLERADRKDDIVNITNLYLESDATHELMQNCIDRLVEHEGVSQFN